MRPAVRHSGHYSVCQTRRQSAQNHVLLQHSKPVSRFLGVKMILLQTRPCALWRVCAFVSLLLASTSSSYGQMAIPVRAVEVTDEPIRLWLLAEGVAHATRREYLWFDRGGRVVEIGLDQDGLPLREGSIVKGPEADGSPGQFIARLDGRSDDERIEQQRARARAAERRVAAARNAVQAARRQYGIAVEQLERSQQLSERGMVQRQRLEQEQSVVALAELQINSREAELAAASAEADAARSGANQALLDSEGGALYAPFDGVLGVFNLREGEQAMPPPSVAGSESQRMKSAAALVLDPATFEVRLELPAYEGVLVRRGQAAQVTWAGFGRFDDETTHPIPVVDAVVHAVNASVSPDSRGLGVRLRTSGDAAALRDGVAVSVRIATGERQVRASLPLRAVRFEQGEAYVYALSEEGASVTRRTIRTGFADGRRVEVLAGLVPGERVVSEGHHRLRDGGLVSVLDEGR